VLAPSGEQIEIAFADQRAIVVEVGGGLRAYSADGHDVLDGYGAEEMCSSGRGQVLVPWPNRLADGAYEFGGERHQLPLTELANGNAIHGLVRWAGWTAREREPHRVLMAHVLRPQPGYPFSLALEVDYVLAEDGLRVTTTATNIGGDPCPYGAGAHPYLRAGKRADETLLRVPAKTVLHADERGIPTGSIAVAGTEFDFREPRQVGETKLDHCFTDLERDDDGVARVTLVDSDGGATLTLWADPSYPYVMVFTGDPLPDVARRSIAVEPMTCAPNAFRSAEGLIVLEPGSSSTGTWGIALA
jgi:aldose 1-epimerase